MGYSTQILMHCFFNKDKTVTHFLHNQLEGLYQALPNLYGVLITKEVGGVKNIVGGLFLKTDNHHDNADFIETLLAASCISPDLMALVQNASSFLPAKMNCPGDLPITENEMLRALAEQYYKFCPEAGNA